MQLAEVEQEIRLLAASYNKRTCRIVADNSQTRGMVQRLVDSGFHAQDWPVMAELNNRMATTLYRLLEGRALDLPDDDFIVEQLSTVRLFRTHLGLRIDHDSGRHDDFACAVGYACIEALDIQKGRRIKAQSVARMRSSSRPSEEQVMHRQLRCLAERGDPTAVRLLRGRVRCATARFTLSLFVSNVAASIR